MKKNKIISDNRLAKKMEGVGKTIPLFENYLIDANQQNALNTYLVNPEQLSPLIKALEDENCILKDEVFFFFNFFAFEFIYF